MVTATVVDPGPPDWGAAGPPAPFVVLLVGSALLDSQWGEHT